MISIRGDKEKLWQTFKILLLYSRTIKYSWNLPEFCFLTCPISKDPLEVYEEQREIPINSSWKVAKRNYRA